MRVYEAFETSEKLASEGRQCDIEFGVFCRDTLDNDLDGVTDCLDADCAFQANCLPAHLQFS